MQTRFEFTLPLEPDGSSVSGRRVVIAAKVSPGIDWAAYFLDEGGNGDSEFAVLRAAREGTKVPEAVARYFFPTISERYRW